MQGLGRDQAWLKMLLRPLSPAGQCGSLPAAIPCPLVGFSLGCEMSCYTLGHGAGSHWRNQVAEKCLSSALGAFRGPWRGSDQLAPNAGVLPASLLLCGLGAAGCRDSVYRPADASHTPSVGAFMNSLPIK